MRPTLDFIREKFEIFNRKMFAGRLPMPQILLSDATSYLGICKSKVKTLPDGTKAHTDFQLRFNSTYDLPERVVEDTVIHEMIHYFILLNGLQDSSPHGYIFKSIMNSINKAYGRELSISHRVTTAQKDDAKAQRRTWHVIAVMRFESGVSGVKVLPRVIPKIVDFYRKVTAIDGVAEVTLHLHDNPYFNKFPTSTALRYHELDRAEIAAELAGARKLIVKGDKLIQR